MTFTGIPAVEGQIRLAKQASRYFSTRIRWQYNALGMSCDAPLYPSRLYRVKLENITHRVSPEPFDRSHAGLVACGNWDRDRSHITHEDELYNALRSRYQYDFDWEEIDFYNQQQDRIKRGDRAWGCSTLVELRKRYSSLDDVYESMKVEGYRSENERSKYKRTPFVGLDEIGVHIARDGELLFAGAGNHRIRLAKLLNLDTVVVQILVRHSDWQAKRENIAGRNLSDRLSVDLSHPDIQNIV